MMQPRLKIRAFEHSRCCQTTITSGPYSFTVSHGTANRFTTWIGALGSIVLPTPEAVAWAVSPQSARIGHVPAYRRSIGVGIIPMVRGKMPSVVHSCARDVFLFRHLDIGLSPSACSSSFHFDLLLSIWPTPKCFHMLCQCLH